MKKYRYSFNKTIGGHCFRNESFQKRKTPFLVFGNLYFCFEFQNYGLSITSASFLILFTDSIALFLTRTFCFVSHMR